MKITVYGDSILKGVVLEDGKYRMERGWEKRLAQEHGLEIRNKAHFGNTLGRAMPQIEKDCAERAEGELAVLEFGGNDCDFDWAAIADDPDGRYVCKTPLTDFEALYRRAIRNVENSGRTPIVLTLPPIHAQRYLDFICRNGLSKGNILRWLGDAEAIYRWQQTYSDLIIQLAREEQAELVDLRRAFPQQSRELESLLCADGIHPSRAGQERIYRVLRQRAEELFGPPEGAAAEA